MLTTFGTTGLGITGGAPDGHGSEEQEGREDAAYDQDTTKMQGSAAYDKSNKLAQTSVAMAASSAKFRAQ